MTRSPQEFGPGVHAFTVDGLEICVVTSGDPVYEATECARRHKDAFVANRNDKTGRAFDRFLAFEVVEDLCRRLWTHFSAADHALFLGCSQNGLFADGDIAAMKEALRICRDDINADILDNYVASARGGVAKH
jgi:hypothetical protein